VLLTSFAIPLWLAVSGLNPFNDPAAHAVVLLFTRTDCPISNRYAPEVRRVYEAYSGKGVKFFLVYPDRDETPEGIAKHRAEYGYTMPALPDPSHTLVDRAQATVTPEAAVFVPVAGKADWKLIYHGRIDDRYVDFGKSRPAPSVHDLQNAIDAALAGRAVTPDHNKAIGCFIADLR
jgi:hypothetical protein